MEIVCCSAVALVGGLMGGAGVMGVVMWLKQRQASQAEERSLAVEAFHSFNTPTTTIDAPGNREFYTDVAL